MRIPVNVKIIALISFTVMVVVGFLILQSVKMQEEDKISQAYQVQLNETVLLGNSFSSYLTSSLNTLRQMASVDTTSANHQEQINAILKNQKEINRVYLVEVPTDASEMNLLYKSSNEYGENETRLVNDSIVNRFESVTKKGFAIANMSSDRGTPQVGVIISDLKYDETGSKVLALVAVLNLESLFSNNQYLIEVIDSQGDLIYNSDFTKLNTQDYNQSLFQKAKRSTLASSTLEVNDSKNTRQLGSYVKLPYEVTFLTTQPLIKVVSSIYVMTQKMIIAGIITLCLAIIFSLILARRYIVNPIENLKAATNKISKGNFDIKLGAKKNDEIGDLAGSFEIMSSKIKVLLKEQTDKVRLENEMNIAATVQKTLFPEKSILTDTVDIFSHYTPASECGGDLWGYFTNKSKMYFIIADATGHGLPSALITVAAKSTMSLIKRMLEKNINITPAEILSYANRSVFETSQGKIMMTCFVGVIDFETGELTYANAGHNPPWVFSGDKVHSLSLPGTRLGESLEQSDFKEKTISIKPNDKIFLYTDGIVENTNTQGEMFDKKRVRNLVKDNLAMGCSQMLSKLLKEFNSFMVNKKHLDDDTTVVIMDVKKIGSVNKEAA